MKQLIIFLLALTLFLGCEDEALEIKSPKIYENEIVRFYPETVFWGDTLNVEVLGNQNNFINAYLVKSIWFAQRIKTEILSWESINDSLYLLKVIIPENSQTGKILFSLYNLAYSDDNLNIIPFRYPEIISIKPNPADIGDSIEIIAKGFKVFHEVDKGEVFINNEELTIREITDSAGFEIVHSYIDKGMQSGFLTFERDLIKIESDYKINVLREITEYEKFPTNDFDRLNSLVFAPLDTIRIDSDLIKTYNLQTFKLGDYKMQLKKDDEGNYFVKIPGEVSNIEENTFVKYFNLTCQNIQNAFILADTIKTYLSRAAFSGIGISITDAKFFYTNDTTTSFGLGVFISDRNEIMERDLWNLADVAMSYYNGYYFPYHCIISDGNINLALEIMSESVDDPDASTQEIDWKSWTIGLSNIPFGDVLNKNHYNLTFTGTDEINKYLKSVKYRYEYHVSKSKPWDEAINISDNLIGYELNVNSVLTISLERK
jgi:hypothetical protein